MYQDDQLSEACNMDCVQCLYDLQVKVHVQVVVCKSMQKYRINAKARNTWTNVHKYVQVCKSLQICEGMQKSLKVG